jgi:putative protease
MSTAPRPEVLAPAGDETALRAALAAGADSVYFGLQEGFNARARAGNFSRQNLGETVARIHRAGARAYLATNTLVFESELPFVEDVVRAAARAGVDALIVQDPAVALLARQVCPELEVHASTQMTISSPEGARFAASLGVTRVVVPRELSVAEIERFARGTDLELEVFVHGALCVSWSGQCLTSEAWEGRSANRGQCAQSCRMPYTLVLDGQARDLGDVRYLLSPKDLAGVRAVPDLLRIGVHGLKIEGRQKNAQYVATATELYRRLVDGAVAGRVDEPAARGQLLRAQLSYSRGFGDGFLGGSDHQSLVEGRFPKHRGVYLGAVLRCEGSAVLVECDGSGVTWTGGLVAEERGAPRGRPSAALAGFGGAEGESSGPAALGLEPRPGHGVVFDAGDPEDRQEPGGPIFAVERRPGGYLLRFGRPGPDLERVRPGDRVWITNDPALAREVERRLGGAEPEGRHALHLAVSGRAGEPLRLRATSGACTAQGESATPLASAQGPGLGRALLEDKLGALGGTPFHLASLDLEGLEPGLHLPVAELKALRRALLAQLLPAIEAGPRRAVAEQSQVEALRAPARALRAAAPSAAGTPLLLPLCRTEAQLEAVLDAGLREVELDWMEFVGLGRAVDRARRAGLVVNLATVRVQKPGEEGFDRRLAALAPDGLLVRHWGALVHFEGAADGAGHGASGRGPRPQGPRLHGPRLHGDFSLNVTNSVTAAELFRRGLDTLTAAHDLDETQLFALLEASVAERITVVLHHHIATFHTEHCVYSHLLSQGRDFHSCGRPCERHRLALRDHRGAEHPVVVDVGCRNTVFDAAAQSAARLVPRLLAAGVRRLRVEFVGESRAEAARILRAYGGLLRGSHDAERALELSGARSQFGVSAAPMAVMGSGG